MKDGLRGLAAVVAFWVVVVGLLGVVCAPVLGGQAEGQEAVRFADRARVAEFLDARPYEAVGLLEEMLSQEQVTALEGAMFPAPGDEEKRLVYERVRTALSRLGLGSGDELIRVVTTRLDALGGAGGDAR